jgi:hypothetical protein
VKPEEVSGNLKDKLSLKQNKTFRDLYIGINGFNKGYQPRTWKKNMRMGDLLAASYPTELAFNFSQPSHYYMNIIFLRLILLL